jgi:hypothetical protein
VETKIKIARYLDVQQAYKLFLPIIQHEISANKWMKHLAVVIFKMSGNINATGLLQTYPKYMNGLHINKS